MTELDRIKDEVAKEYGHTDWFDMINYFIKTQTIGVVAKFTMARCEEVSQRYATACVKASQGWVSVEERLPEERIMSVLVFNGDAPDYNRCVAQATWFIQSGGYFKRETTGPYLGSITHWKPMPTFPDNIVLL